MSKVTDIASTLKSVAKVILQSRSVKFPDKFRGTDKLIIMGNGPSLRKVLDDHLDVLRDTACMAVNFAANTPDFFKVKPALYTIADPHFYQSTADENVTRLLSNLSRVDWPMYLFVPREAADNLRLLISNDSITVVGYNAVGVEGWSPLVHKFFDLRLAMPRPRNVMIPSIMIGAWLGFSNIYLAGADHSWTQGLGVAPDNRVITNLPHYYQDNAHEQSRVKAVYTHHHLHDLFLSYYIAFKAYHEIQAWAAKRNIHIYNVTPGSFIDAFTRVDFPVR